jgi:hypothetical protein
MRDDGNGEKERLDRSKHTGPRPPTFRHLQKACRKYQRSEKPAYRVTTLFLKPFKGPKDVADGICVLLLIWNKAFYDRYGSPSCRDLTTALQKNSATIAKLRTRSILSYRPMRDDGNISSLFRSLRMALRKKGRRKTKGKYLYTPVGVAKALHLLAPDFLPAWDDSIARKYHCAWSKRKPAAARYLEFVNKIQEVCEHVVADYAKTNHVDRRTAVKRIEHECSPSNCRHSLVKLVDEYNFMRFVKAT